MKISDFAGIPFASLQRIPQRGLLCGTLRSPVEVSFGAEIPNVLAFAGPIRFLWERNQRAEAIAKLAETTRSVEHNASVSIPTLFLLAHMQMEVGDSIGGERYLQQALKKLGQQADTDARHGQILSPRFKSFNALHRYALCDRDWLVLAIQAVLKDDFESCLRWILQTDRRTFDRVTTLESARRLRLIGDIQVVLACVAVQTNELEVAEKLLSTAYARHSQAEAFRSVCRDLILTSRLAEIQGQTQRAATLLDAAECELMMALTPTEAQQCPLMHIIHAA